MGNKVIGIIIDFVKALQSKDRALISIESNRTYKISSPKYLLGQILRQYELEQNKYYYSTSAKLLWEKLSTQDMWNYSYRQYVHCENDEPVLISEYTGNGNVPREKRKVQRRCMLIARTFKSSLLQRWSAHLWQNSMTEARA